MPISTYYQENREKCLTQQKEYYSRNKEKCKAYSKKWYDDLYNGNKDWAIEYLGGECSHCKGKFHRSVYDFHHLNPEEKETGLAKLLKKRNRDNIKEELDKCILLCANCHRIEHHKKEE